jgi:hypothetical protein
MGMAMEMVPPFIQVLVAMIGLDAAASEGGLDGARIATH